MTILIITLSLITIMKTKTIIQKTFNGWKNYNIELSLYQPQHFCRQTFIHSCWLSRAKWSVCTVSRCLLPWDHLIYEYNYEIDFVKLYVCQDWRPWRNCENNGIIVGIHVYSIFSGYLYYILICLMLWFVSERWRPTKWPDSKTGAFKIYTISLPCTTYRTLILCFLRLQN